MARKRPSGSRESTSRALARKKKRPPQGWIRIVWGQVVRPKAGSSTGNIQLRLRQNPGEPRTIALTYALTKKALGK